MCNTAMNYVDFCPCSPSIGDGEVNYFVEMSSDSETEQPHYMDFFDPPSCEGEEEEEEEEEEEIEEDEDKEEKEENMAMRKEESDFSTHERRQQKVGVTHDSALTVESVPPLNPPPPPSPAAAHYCFIRGSQFGRQAVADEWRGVCKEQASQQVGRM